MNINIVKEIEEGEENKDWTRRVSSMHAVGFSFISSIIKIRIMFNFKILVTI